MNKVVTPYKDVDRSKKEQVAEMFDNIAPSYDFLNHSLSMGIDRKWRKKAIEMLRPLKPKKVLDIATGTGDFAIEAIALDPEEIIGVDISAGMLEIGRKKIDKIGKSALIRMEIGDSESLNFDDNSIDAITVGFGARNFENLSAGLSEIKRVLRPGGAAVILEPSVPRKFPMKQLFGIYFKGILPFVGRIVSGDKRAYTYLPESVGAFPNGKEFVAICDNVGFSNTTFKPLTLGICSLYFLVK